MKRVLFMLAVCSLSASGAYAQSKIVNSAHDLSPTSTFKSPVDGTTQYGAAETDRLCVYCHTPHYARTTAPLWNRSDADLASATPYASGTFDFAPDYTSGDIPLCMSCHDGDMTRALINLNGKNSDLLTPAADRTLTMVEGPALIGTNFTNDHPVGFVYDHALDKQGGLKDIVGTLDGDLLLRGAASNEVWCSSCHNVHDPGTGGTAPFLRVSNTGSALCLKCHDK